MTVDRRRLIIDTDAKNEADDQYAIVHALLSPTLDIRGVVPAHFGRERSSRSMAESRAEVDLLLQLMGLAGEVTVADGASEAIPDESNPAPSAGAQLIIDESRLATADDPLFVAFLGPLTDMASAILMESALSFMGLGDPNVVSWGSMIGNGRNSLRTAWYLCAIPGVAIILTVLSINLVAEGLNDVLNPRLQR
jgi:inosine-uridine nucleoside N-ribohydrolase